MSFKVICVTNTADPAGGDPAPELSVGSTYTVIDEMEEKVYKTVLYELAEVANVLFDRAYFAPISGISDEEIAQELQAEAMDRVWKGIVRELDKMENA